MATEQLGERRLVMEHADHLGLAHPHDLTLDHRTGRRQPERLADQSAFAEELGPGTEHGDHRLPTLLGGDYELDAAFLDLEDRIGRTGLPKNDGVLGVS